MQQRVRAQISNGCAFWKTYCRLLCVLGLSFLLVGEGMVQAQSTGYAVSAGPTTVPPGGTLTASWQAPSNHAVKDWIGLFVVGAGSNGFVTWKYVGSGTSGTMAFTAPNTNVPQKYELRYLLNDGFSKAAVSAPITVTTAAPTTGTTPPPIPSTTTYALSAAPSSLAIGGAVTVTWQAPSTHGTSDWVGLFITTQPSAGNTIVAWKYVPSGTTGTMTFPALNLAPNQTYEFRYLLNNGYTKTATSNPIKLATTGTGAGTSGTATLTWTSSPSSDVTGYKVYRSTAPGVYGGAIATLPRSTLTYQASGLQANTTYFFVVTAVDGSDNESAYSNEVSKSIY